MKVLMFFLFFLLLGAFFIVSNENLRLNNPENIDVLFDEYAQWLDDLVGNSRTVTGHVVNMKWLPNKGEVSE